MKKALLACDGGARGNPGPAGAGAVLRTLEGDMIAQAYSFLGATTNNVAEYQGILLGLDLALKNKIEHLEIRLDSELVVKQLRGEYKVRHPGLQPLWYQARQMLTRFSKWNLAHIPREMNKEADRLVNEAIDENLHN
ncbi:ribonuclease HI family protein [bacterium]|nr:ribonuclease HI family protein [bacterium]